MIRLIGYEILDVSGGCICHCIRYDSDYVMTFYAESPDDCNEQCNNIDGKSEGCFEPYTYMVML